MTATLALVGGLVAVALITAPRAHTAWTVWRIRREYRRMGR